MNMLTPTISLQLSLCLERVTSHSKYETLCAVFLLHQVEEEMNELIMYRRGAAISVPTKNLLLCLFLSLTIKDSFDFDLIDESSLLVAYLAQLICLLGHLLIRLSNNLPSKPTLFLHIQLHCCSLIEEKH